MRRFDNLIGQKFGRLEVLSRDDDSISASGRHRVRWLCQCDCGNTVSVLSDNLKRGKTTSCGCFRVENTKRIKSTHGDTQSRLYGIWCAMKSRCTNENNAAYKDYGGRGITVCDEWMHNYDAFKSWAIGNGYSDNLTIDRIDNDESYSPSNCRWVDGVAQANNRRSNRLLTLNGETHNVTEWASILEVSPKTIFNRIYTGYSVDDALSF